MKDELQKLWATETPPALTEEERNMIVQKAERKLAAFDRRLQWRELREVLPAIVVSAMFGAYFMMSSTPLARLSAVVMVAISLWIAFYLLRHGRGPANPSPAAPLSEYRDGVAAKFDHQIRLLSNARYWYVLPFYLGFILYTVGNIEKHDWVVRRFDWWFMGYATAICGFTLWLNEVVAVRRLRTERDGILSMLEGE